MADGSRRGRPALLLSQLGDFASSLFAEGAAQVGVTPAEAGVVRIIGRAHGLSQRQLAERLGAPPSRLVALLDGLEGRGLVVRSRRAGDRRAHELSLTADGEQLLDRLTRLVAEQERALLSPLGEDEAQAFVATLVRLADAHGLDQAVHRGYRVGRSYVHRTPSGAESV